MVGVVVVPVVVPVVVAVVDPVVAPPVIPAMAFCNSVEYGTPVAGSIDPAVDPVPVNPASSLA